ncbi:hypothetical protein CFOL_v3_10354 [Cephalotus follicularis]|uniref:Uncharacterized protein n=1 Tax=Cephalotus follicularis TaxID=3775 RepID=A0A1Q3BG54_CEPFO|nr:hypothetical protein CFOL_v3_10354 [Cephalotus follicularis]
MTKPEERLSRMETMFSGFVLDPSKCSRLSLGEKRELVHEIAHWSKDAPEILSSFTRRELLEIICAEMGKERKYTGYSKLQMIEHLLKLVSQKSKKSNTENFLAFSASKTLSGLKRTRQKEPQLQLFTDLNHIRQENNKEEPVKIQLCQNVACRATLNPDDVFCKRCSCCICHLYDDNKDPSLWLTCGFDDENNSCGMSCHLRCALKDERAGIVKSSCCTKLDGSYYCVSCGKSNGLMRIWRQQLLVATGARRVDVLCLRISLGYEILMGTQKFKEMQKTVETAVQMLSNEVGPLNLLCTKMGRGIVSRLACGAEVQKLCASAVEEFNLMFLDGHFDHMEKAATCKIRFEELSSTSVIIALECANHLSKDFLGCKLWHRKSTIKEYPENATFIALKPEKRFKVSDLSPSTEYFCKVSLFGGKGNLGVWEAKWITPKSSRSSVIASAELGAEGNTLIGQIHSQMESTNSSLYELDHPPKFQSSNDIDKKNGGLSSLPPSTPCKFIRLREMQGLGSKKRMEESDYEYSVRVVKRLEHEGHIEQDFRVKFLTWFSLKATMHERRVVNVFVDAFKDDPQSLAGQLIHTFIDSIRCEQKPVPQQGFCSRLWH